MANSATRDNTTKGHLRGSVLLVAGRVLAILINFGVQIVTVRYLTKADYGILAFALSAASILSIINSFGMDKSVSRFLSVYLQDADYPRFWGVLVLMLATVAGLGVLGATLFLAAWGMGLSVLSSDRTTQLVLAILSVMAICTALDGLFVSLFAVLAKPSAVFFRRHLLGPLVKLTAALTVALSGGGLVAFACGQLVAEFVGVGVSSVMFWRILSTNPPVAQAFHSPYTYPVRQLYSFSATLLTGDLAFMLRGALVPLVLGLLYSGIEVATYQAVVPFARLNEFVLLTFSFLFLPSAAKLAAAQRDSDLQTLFEKTTLWVTLLSFPVFAACFLTSNSVPALILGDAYQSSSHILAWLSLGFYANAAFGTGLRLLRATGSSRVQLAADLSLVVLAVLLIILLVPRFGAIGGAWAVCGTYVGQSILYQALVAKTSKVNPLTRVCIAPFVLGVTLCVAAETARALLGGGLIFSATTSVIVTLAVFLAFGRELEIFQTFPELARVPVVRRWGPMRSSGANLP